MLFMDGIEVVEKIRSVEFELNCFRVFIVVLLVNVMLEYIKVYEMVGMDICLLKLIIV